MTSWTMLTSPPNLKVWRPWIVEKTSVNWMRCSSGSATRGRALGMPKVTTPVATLGPEALAPAVSRSRPYWKWTWLTECWTILRGEAADQEALVVAGGTVGRWASCW